MRCPVHRRFFLIRRSSIDGSPVRSSISLFVTLSIQVILMIERRCRIMKACNFFTCRLYTVQASAPYRRVDSTIARYILPLTRMDTWWLFQSLWRSRMIFFKNVVLHNFQKKSYATPVEFRLVKRYIERSTQSLKNV